MNKRKFADRAWVVAVSLAVLPLVAVAGPAPAFDLPRWEAEGRVRLEDFAGQIVVLDFFAYWCAPCERASKEIETGIQQYYSSRGGNARGVPVRVMSVNVEQDFPDRTKEFVERTGISFVVNDPSGALLEQLGRSGIPYLVVIDGSGSKPDLPRFEVIYQQGGFEGLRQLRGVIDGLGPVPAETRGLRMETRASVGSSAPIVQRVEPDAEFQWASDIFLTDTKLFYTANIGSTEVDATFGYATFNLDYQTNASFDVLGMSEQIHEDRWSGQLEARHAVSDTVKLIFAGGYYDGYLDYRRVWIANFYRQQYGNPAFGTVPFYEEPNPRGYNVSAGTRWEYLPAQGFAELRLGYAHDWTAPSYEVDPGTGFVLPGRKQLDTEFAGLSFENVLHRRVRTLNEFAVSVVTGREPRFRYKGSVNAALGERWVLRGYGGFTTEKNTFDAQYGGLTLEYEVFRGLLLSVAGRYYRDSGEVFDPDLLSDAAPPLKSWDVGVGVRYAWGDSSFKIYVAPLWTDYKVGGFSSEQFRNLYADRNWGLAQIAFSHQF